MASIAADPEAAEAVVVDEKKKKKKKKKDKKDKKKKKDKKDNKKKKLVLVMTKESEQRPAAIEPTAGDGASAETKAVADAESGGQKRAPRKIRRMRLSTATNPDSESKAVAEQDADTPTKKLSNKERRRLQKEREAKAAAERQRRIEAYPFTVSHIEQAIKDPESWARATDVNINEFTIAGSGRKGTQLFENAELKIVAGRRYGLIGPNGMGKSTLLKLISMGRIPIPPAIDVLMVEQEIEGSDYTAIETVLAADKRRDQLLEAEEIMMAKLDSGEFDENESFDDVISALDENRAELEAIGAAGAEARARAILSGLGFSAEMQDRETFKFSGGWRMRISLARALYVQPTLLLLDEPTNHLDLNAVLWLDHYLQNWKSTLVVVSHDQDFLNNVVTDVIHLKDRKLLYYRGNYEKFRQASEQAYQEQYKLWEKQQKQLRALKRKNMKTADAKSKIAKKMREGGGARKKKGAERGARGGEVKMDSLVERPSEYRVHISFPPPNDLSPPIIEIMDISFGYEGHPLLFKNVSMGIGMDSRICMVGPNGVGKSTLLNLIMGELEPTRGLVRRNHRLRLGRYNQHFMEVLPMDKTPVQFLMSNFPHMEYQATRNLLGRYGLGGHAHENLIKSCSGGQKARIVMASLALQEPHILVLDEPTNHLDIETIDALAEALRTYEGGVILVSHDARLIMEAGCDLYIVNDKTVTRHDGGFDEYREALLDEIAADAEEAERLLKEKLEARAKQRQEALQAMRKISSAE